MMTTSKTKIPQNSKLVTSAEVVASIEDLLIHIFLYMPTRSLACFMLVSKHWKSIITSPQLSLLRNPNLTAVGLFHPLKEKVKFEYINFNPKAQVDPAFRELMFPNEDSSCFWVSQSCNGLLVCLCGNSVYSGTVMKCYIHNPTTNQFRKIPIPSDDSVHGVYMAFDPSKSPHCKIICVRRADVTCSKNVEILSYSFDFDSWSVCSGPFSPGDAKFYYAVYWNNSINWISFDTGELLYFDVDKERLGRVPTPSRGWRTWQLQYFGVSCGDLHLVERSHRHGKIIIFEMKKDHSGWIVKHRVDLSLVSELYPWMFYYDYDYSIRVYHFSVYSFVGGTLSESPFLVLEILGKVLRFNIGSGTIEQLHNLLGGCYSYNGYPMPFEYIEYHGFI